MRQLIHLRKDLKPCAWTGGNRPSKRANCTPEEKDLITLLFRDQCLIWREFWGNWQWDKWDLIRLFYNRARYDAHATIQYNYQDKG